MRINSINDSELLERFGPSYDDQRRFMTYLPAMIDLARDAEETDSASWRGLTVGAAAYAAATPWHPGGIITAGNVKNNKNIETVCAEKRLEGAAKKLKIDKIVGIVVASTVDSDEILSVSNGYAAHTLDPCYRCRTSFEDNDMIGDDVLIVSTGRRASGRAARRENDIYQVNTFGQLRDKYKRPPVSLHEQQVTRGFDELEARVRLYDILAGAERTRPEEERRSPALLAQMALAA